MKLAKNNKLKISYKDLVILIKLIKIVDKHILINNIFHNKIY